MTTNNSIFLSALATASVMGLAGCGGGSSGTQDVGASNPSSRVLAARAVDGYLAGAAVYVDQNENGELDAFEPRAQTDVNGFFSYNHITDTDYCAGASNSPNARYCLRASIAADASVLIRVTGGYDTVTGLPFVGTLSLRSSELDSGDLRLVTPLTSMTTNPQMTAAQKYQALIDSGIMTQGGSVDADHIAGSLAETATRAQFATILARILGEASGIAAPSFSDVPDDWASGYIGIASLMASQQAAGFSGDLMGVFSQSGNAEQVVRQMVFSQMHPGQTMPDSFVLPNASAANSLLSVVPNIIAVSESLVERLGAGATTAANLAAALRAQAIMAEMAVRDPTNPEIDDYMQWVDNQLAQGSGLGTDLSALGGDNVDLSLLIDPEFDFDPNSNSISASAIIPPAAAVAFSALVNNSIGMSVNDSDERGAALLFIGGENGARSGQLNICVRYRDDSGDFDTATSSDPNGAMLVKGQWSLLNDHSLVLSLDVAGGLRTAMLKSVGIDGLDRQYRFDFGSDLAEWTGSPPQGFAVGAVPAGDATCKASLIDRFGPA